MVLQEVKAKIVTNKYRKIVILSFTSVESKNSDQKYTIDCMLSKNEIKFITSLQQKKYRMRSGFFPVEGVKVVNDCIQSSLKVQNIYATNNYKPPIDDLPIQRISEVALNKISTLKTPNEVLAIVEIPENKPIKENGIIIALDGVRDPGNLGTIIRLCDWFGVDTLICSHDTVDCYNPKVVQATMGSIVRVNILYLVLDDFFKTTNLPLYFMTLEGHNVYDIKPYKDAVIVLGSESHGIRATLHNIKHKAITIPCQNNHSSIDSLNVSIATAIVLSEFCKS